MEKAPSTTPPVEPGASSTPSAPKRSRWVSVLREAINIAVFALVMLAARSSIADHYKIPSGSMEFTLRPGDRIVVDKLAYGIRLPFTRIELVSGSVPQRGELVIFDSPVDGTRLIKRVVAVEGDEVLLRRGHLTVNGKSLGVGIGIEDFGNRRATLNLRHGGGPDFGPVFVPEGDVMVLGDARGNSRDSRFFGFISADTIYGRALGLYFRKGEGLVWQRL